ncbi:type II toxin-antitoxin system VapC family toxin [Deinococcus metallilatus]|uniref:Type II toxin-antitoxin system VapC family toxin n=1 Tax=Deinococcus metallilatus TaxID=1211322 RepID=A0AAJ5F3W8_9DEIO|nr:type II toxin-antitoxin system VapC family toxin [Deinococcus metallilatus]MBB5295049.1 hypothetical protein [Deinococcus metallilatus]QBY08769.1 type II toxin-antitoxin system VapC family toxin [Deinococcus metallilatus]RXJ10649.1 type II toxin-antitoxin system VapC family toxin [Deinococcus metallilatus]TLK26620.1 type II toxin-antitoxin system VapC family toxin [Deinococcus metallilatus]GMA14821.1 plasmid stabilization protein [Deinococcus metallilatus]
MPYLLDTHTVSETAKLRSNPGLMAFLSSVPLSETYLSAVTAGEIEYGVERLSDPVRRAQLRVWANRLLDQEYRGRVLPVTKEVMATWAQLVLRSGKTPGQLPRMDSLLAATALHHGLTLVTCNTADFEALGVPLLNPWET